MGTIIDINSAALFASKKKEQAQSAQDVISLVSLDNFRKSYLEEIETKFKIMKINIAHFNEAVRGIEMTSGTPQQNIPNISVLDDFLIDPWNEDSDYSEYEIIHQIDKDGNQYRAVMQVERKPGQGIKTSSLVTKESRNGELFCYVGHHWEKSDWNAVYGHSRLQHMLIQNEAPVAEMIKAVNGTGESVSDEEVKEWEENYEPLLALYEKYPDDCCIAYTKRKEGPFILMPRATNKLGSGIGMTKNGFALYQFIPSFIINYLKKNHKKKKVEPDYLLQVDSIDADTAERIILKRFCHNKTDNDKTIMYIPASADIFIPLFFFPQNADAHIKALNEMNLSEQEWNRVDEVMKEFIDHIEAYVVDDMM